MTSPPVKVKMMRIFEDDAGEYIPETAETVSSFSVQHSDCNLIKFLNYTRCVNFGLCVGSFCCYICPLLVSDKIAKAAFVRLTPDNLEFQEVIRISFNFL